MKIRVLTIMGVCAATLAFGQDKKVYTTTSGELIFSFANINYKGSEASSVMRFSPVLNIQNWLNVDHSDKFGMFTGLSLRNVGFIYDVPDQPNTRMKHRTYNIGIPAGIKLGNLNKAFLFAGYEIEFPINYKEKKFVDEDKVEKDVYWFTKRVTPVQHSLMAGIQLPYGATLKFKYYLTNFFNKDYTLSDGTKPYAVGDYNIFYFSLNFGLLKNTDFYYNNK